MSSVNKVTLIGRLGADPEVRYTQEVSLLLTCELQPAKTGQTEMGNAKSERSGTRLYPFAGKQAELCGQYLSKGRQVYLEGRIQSREYTDKEGINRKAVDIVASQVVFLGGRQEGSGGQWGANQNSGWGSAPQKSEQSSGWGQNQGGGGGGGGGWVVAAAARVKNAGGGSGGWGQTKAVALAAAAGDKRALVNQMQDNAAPTNNDDDPIPF